MVHAGPRLTIIRPEGTAISKWQLAKQQLAIGKSGFRQGREYLTWKALAIVPQFEWSAWRLVLLIANCYLLFAIC
jgi:hypothetical protein